MDARVIVGVAVAAVLAGGAVVLHQRSARARAAAAPPAPPEGLVAPQAEPGTPPPTGMPQAAKDLLKAGGATAATVVAGIKLQNTLGDIAEKVGGEGAGMVARVAPAVVGAGVILAKGAEAALDAVGVDEVVGKEGVRIGGIVAGTAIVVGAVPAATVALTQLAGNVSQEVLKLVAGEKVERAVSNAVSQLDPFKTGSLANKAVAPVAGAVSFAGKALGGVLGGGPSPEEVAVARAELAVQVEQGNFLGIKLGAPAPPSPAAPPPFVFKPGMVEPPRAAPPPLPPPVLSLPAVLTKPFVAPPAAAKPATKTIVIGGRTISVAV